MHNLPPGCDPSDPRAPWNREDPPCEACDGTGRVVEVVTHVVDRRTKWQRSADEQLNVDCPSCDGTGREEVKA